MPDIEYYTIVYACHLCEGSEFSNARNLRDHYENVEAPMARPEVDTSFKTLKSEKKWTLLCLYQSYKSRSLNIKQLQISHLSTGTVVENQLYEFGKLQIEEHPSQSLIFDVNDSELYNKHGIFTSGEIEEIMSNCDNVPLQLPDNFKQYLNKFNYKSTVDIRKTLNEKESWGRQLRSRRAYVWVVESNPYICFYKSTNLIISQVNTLKTGIIYTCGVILTDALEKGWR
ncbi:hypothetical protein BDF20DRAFT_990731 [Mycotypha africana]|uniref:uncharacterized protein n=1 Tax=Mycotypha africana TaxID=64632 RepID=UPI0023013AB0|nr:uncharacterized protein BDF20DRAFT_990731 [Mycotypha africana]KAI8968841.1 hypothetical protein BDF20DRAFT_990731 [Mycotypha africana]